MTLRRVSVVAVHAVALALTLAACTSSASTPSQPAGTPNGSPAVSALPTQKLPSLTATPDASPSTPISTPPSAPTSSDSAGAPTTAPPAPRSTCTSVTVRVIRGSAAAGREFAALQFTNTGSSACVLNGYASVTLLRHGKQIGKASGPAGSAASSRRLAPGETAESKLNDYVMNCQAPLSDQIRTRVPGSSITAVAPGQLRACTLRVSPLGAPE